MPILRGSVRCTEIPVWRTTYRDSTGIDKVRDRRGTTDMKHQ